MKSLKSNTVKPKNKADFFIEAGKNCSTEEQDSSGEDSEKSSDIETNDEVYAGHHFSSFIPWSILLWMVEFFQGCILRI